MKLNVGCGTGSDVLPGWVNIDVAAGEGVDVVADCCHLPYQDGEVDAIRSCHMLEHLTKPELDQFARECQRVLRPGGTVEIVCPALDSIVAFYWPRREQQGMDSEDFPITPLDWLDNLLYSRHLHATDYHRQGFYPQKLLRVFGHFVLHQFNHQDRPYSRWEIRMTCCKPESPLCSIVLSTRNKAEYLDRTLASIFGQQVPFPYEVIVIDDGSTDSTRSVCDKYAVVYRFLDNPRYRNPSIARNAGYRLARGRIVICQSDDIVHQSPNTIELLTTDLRPGEFLLAKVNNWKYADDKPVQHILEYCGPNTRRPYFFLGSLWRKDLYAVGGCDEEFVEPCYDDNWLADCLIRGRKLQVRYTDAVGGYHQSHPYGKNTHAEVDVSRRLYARKVVAGVFQASGGPWQYEENQTVAKVAGGDVLPSVHVEAVVGQIPRTMSFFWTAEKLSWMRYMTLRSFRRYHPDWQITVYTMPIAGGKTWTTSEQSDSQIFDGEDYSARLTELGVEIVDWTPPLPTLAPAHACDLCQWQHLANCGGFFADMDILWTGALPYDSLCRADGVFCLSGGWMAIGFLASQPDRPLFHDLKTDALQHYSPKAYQSTGAEAVYRLGGLGANWTKANRPGEQCLSVFRQRYPALAIMEAPSHLVYPWSYLEIDQVFSRAAEIPSGCCGIHWFGGNQLAQEWNRKLTESNYTQYDNTFTRYARAVTP